MAYNKTSEERKWNYWKEQEEKKLRELGMEEEKIQKLRQMDREDFLEERRYREHLDEMMQDMDSIKQRDRGRLAENAHTYGFIKRYPSNRTDITGVINEPWHYRYVGKEAASEIYSQGICLEEYIDTLE